jgi:recombination protein RecT
MSENAQKTISSITKKSGMTRIKNYMLSDEVKRRFTEMMGRSGIYYLNQVLIVCANDEKLQQCDPQSILISAMRAATLRLSVDPSSGQAWIIPYKKQATFQLGYKGVYELAQRTNLYRFINMIDIYQGEEVIEDRMTGMHTIAGVRTGDKVIGRMLYFKLVNGFEKTYYMTIDEIGQHAEHYSPGYNNPKSKWNDPHERPKMEAKTVLMNGLRQWGRFRPEDEELIGQIEDDQSWSAGLPEEDEVTPPEPPPDRTPEEIIKDLGFEDKPGGYPGTTEVSSMQEDAAAPENPFAHLDLMATTDPTTAYWTLTRRVDMEKSEAQSVLKEKGGDFAAAYNWIRQSEWCQPKEKGNVDEPND